MKADTYYAADENFHLIFKMLTKILALHAGCVTVRMQEFDWIRSLKWKLFPLFCLHLIAFFDLSTRPKTYFLVLGEDEIESTCIFINAPLANS